MPGMETLWRRRPGRHANYRPKHLQRTPWVAYTPGFAFAVGAVAWALTAAGWIG